MNTAKKQRKTIEQERLEISSRKWRDQGNISNKDEYNKGQKWQGQQKQKRLRRGKAFSVCLVAQLCLTLCYPMDCGTSGFPVLHYLLEFAQTHVH